MYRLTEYNRTWKNINQVYSAYAKKAGISESKFLIIYTLYTQHKTAQKELCESLTMPKQTVSAVLAALAEEGLIKTEFDEGSKKSKVISLSDKGREQTKVLIKPVLDAERAALDKIKQSDFDAMIKSYDAFKENLEKYLNLD